MEALGECLMRLRKQKGWSQEVLADKAGINLRTLQRLEKGECFPRGKTLELLCVALDVSIDELVDYGKREDRSFLMWFQLSPIAGLILPLGSVLLPLILWLAKRDQIVRLQEQGVNVINFQLLTTAVWYIFQIISLVVSMSQSMTTNSWDMPLFLSGMKFVLVANIAFRVVFYLVWPIVAACRIRRDDPVRLYYPRIVTIVR